ncbi:hypothetical protein M8J77_008298 [Diaphorina citri]|nr:hypothetical protein M8J77_008298 [Diaphorina citri]
MIPLTLTSNQKTTVINYTHLDFPVPLCCFYVLSFELEEFHDSWCEFVILTTPWNHQLPGLVPKASP